MEAGVDLYLEVYIDVIFLINFAMDIVLLYIVKKILKCPGTKLRMFLGAATGAVGACILAVIPDMMALLQFLISYVFLCFAMVLISFPIREGMAKVKAVAVLYITTFFLGGVLNSLYYYTKLGYYFRELIHGIPMEKNTFEYYITAFLIGLIAIYVFVKTLFSFRKQEVQIYPTDFFLENKSVRVMGLLDTGNNLYDPIYGKPVIIAEYSVLSKLLTEGQAWELQAWILNLEGKNSLSRSNEWMNINDEERLNITMIPYQSIGKKKGMLPAITLKKVVLWVGEEQICNDKVLTAVSMDQLSKQNKYQVILHRDMM
jgi:stage II sporulation protein GA (sporulation sigma-E factor processing peptidase)